MEQSVYRRAGAREDSKTGTGQPALDPLAITVLKGLLFFLRLSFP